MDDALTQKIGFKLMFDLGVVVGVEKGAEVLYRRALVTREKGLRADHPDVKVTKENMIIGPTRGDTQRDWTAW